MGLTSGFRDYVFDVLSPLGKIETKQFFGLDGVKADGVMLGFVLDDKIYLRTDEASRDAYTAERCKPYSFAKAGERIVTSYFAIPDRLYDELDELVRWARRARIAALKAPSAVKRRQRNASKAARSETVAARRKRERGRSAG